MTGSAVIGNTTNLPVRSTVAIVAALFPIAVAALAGAWPAGWRPWRPSTTARLSVVAVLVLAVAWVVVNHERTFQRTRSQQTLDPDAIAMGAWLREAVAQPDGSGPVGNARIVHIWVGTSSAYPDYSIAYLFGRPEKTRFHPPSETIAQVLSAVRGGELLVTDQPVLQPGLKKIATIGRYQVFRADTSLPAD